MSKVKTGLLATSLRKVMTSAIFIIIILATVGFYFAQEALGNYAAQADTTTSGASASGSNPQALSKLNEEIAKNQAAGTKAGSLVASSQNYQTQIMKDIYKYAEITNITVDSITSSQPANISGGATSVVEGLKSNFITTTLSNPVPIKNLIQFLKLVETSVPKMLITGINITPSAGSSDNVTIDPLTIEVYTK